MIILADIAMLPLRVVNLGNFDFTRRANSSNVVYFVIGIAVLAIILVIANVLNNKVSASKKGRGPDGRRHFSFFALHRLARDIGLNREQTRMFEFVLKNGAVTDLESLLNSAELLDRHFKRAYRLIERSSSTIDELNDRLALLFSTRNVIEANTDGGIIATSTRQIPDNAEAVLSIGDMTYPVKVVSSRGETLVIERPVSNTGRVVNLPAGSKAHLAIFNKSSKGFTVETRIVDSVQSKNGPVVQLAHSGEIRKLSNRRFRRYQTIIATSFFFVHVEGTRKNKKMVLDKRRFTGNIMDISIGGCSIKTNAPISSGQRLKIEFTCSDNSIVAALGEVLRTNRTGVNTIMHIKFLKVPRKTLNSINAIVYEYTDD